MMRGLARWLYRCAMRRAWRLLPRDRSRKDVLFLCQNGLMADYLGPVLDCVRDDDRLRCHATFPHEPHVMHEAARIRERLPVTEVPLRRAYVRPWDLIITADHGHGELATNARCPVVFTGHGITGKVVAGEDGDYTYGPRTRRADGEPRYSVMFEAADSNRDRVVAERPEYAGVVRVVGSLLDDRLLGQLPRRAAIRAELGLCDDDVSVFVIGSWGPQSLFHVIGDGLIDAARALRDEFEFTLCVHPHEYRPRPDGERVWGHHLRELAAEGFRVREPADDWVPHMVACDVIVTDHTSLAMYGCLAGKPMLYSPVPEEFIESGTPLHALRAMCDVIDDPSQLGPMLRRTLTDFPLDALAALANEVNSRPAQSRALVRAEIYALLGLDVPAAERQREQEAAAPLSPTVT